MLCYVYLTNSLHVLTVSPYNIYTLHLRRVLCVFYVKALIASKMADIQMCQISSEYDRGIDLVMTERFTQHILPKS